MCITEYDEQKTMAAFGRKAAHKQAVQGSIRMIKRGRDTLEEIAEILDLPLEEVIALNKEAIDMCKAMEDYTKKQRIVGAIDILKLDGVSDEDIIAKIMKLFDVTRDYVLVLLTPKTV